MWADESVFYQIYPLGMCGAPHENDGRLEHRIRRVLDFIPHLQKLGVNAVLFNPLFESDAHGYDTRDYRKVDVRLGTNEDLKEVCDAGAEYSSFAGNDDNGTNTVKFIFKTDAIKSASDSEN